MSEAKVSVFRYISVYKDYFYRYMTFGIKKATFGTFFLIIFGYEVRWTYLANKSNKDMDSQLQQIAQYLECRKSLEVHCFKLLEQEL